MNSTAISLLTIWPAFIQGLAISFSLIVAIGAQNAFVLRQGLRREHIGHVVLFCAIADAVLVMVGVFGMAEVLSDRPDWARVLALAGATFLAWYGFKALMRMCKPDQLRAKSEGENLKKSTVLMHAVAFTLLNPHVYLDTVLLAGSIGAQQPEPLQGWFVAGAATASSLWFVLLGFGARWLAPWFAHPKAWQVLDGVIGLTMWTLSAWMIQQAFT